MNKWIFKCWTITEFNFEVEVSHKSEIALKDVLNDLIMRRWVVSTEGYAIPKEHILAYHAIKKNKQKLKNGGFS
jgi:hypothetical protein